MRLSKNMLHPRPYAQGYTAHSTAHVNTEEGILQIGGSFVPENPEFVSFPKSISLVAQLVPILRHSIPLEACITHDLPTPFHPCSLYNMWGDLGTNGQHERIQLVIKTLGGPFVENSDGFKGRVLYEKIFQWQNAPVVLNKRVEDGHVVVTPPGIKGGEPLWAYGGYYRPGCCLEDIEQIVFTLTPKGQHTAVFPTRLSQWMLKGMQPWLPAQPAQTSIFIDPIPKIHSQNLKADIEHGAICLNVPYGVDESGDSLEIPYYSTHVSMLDSFLGTVDITLAQRT